MSSSNRTIRSRLASSGESKFFVRFAPTSVVFVQFGRRRPRHQPNANRQQPDDDKRNCFCVFSHDLNSANYSARLNHGDTEITEKSSIARCRGLTIENWRNIARSHPLQLCSFY